MNLTVRYIARIVVEAQTPLAVGSGEKGLNTDRLVVKDANGLPYIPGTSLTGVLRHNVEEDWVQNVFGYGGEDGEGSRLIVSSGFLIGDDGVTVMEGLRKMDMENVYFSYFDRLPERDHVRINHRGVADVEGRGKFDEELVHKGTRFMFEIKLLADESRDDWEIWKKLIYTIDSPLYRIGAGTRKGFGSLKIIPELSYWKKWDLTIKDDLLDFIHNPGSLNGNTKSWNQLDPAEFQVDEIGSKGWVDYSVLLKATDFFSFSAGYGDHDADRIPKTESFFDWSSGKPILTKSENVLIPATSIKGALSHRTAFYYNQLKQNYIQSNRSDISTKLDFDKIVNDLIERFSLDEIDFSADSSEWSDLEEAIENIRMEDVDEWDQFRHKLDLEVDDLTNKNLSVAENNYAVQQLFGYAKSTENENGGQRGRVIIEDVYISADRVEEKVFNHTFIDRFTGGTRDGALFQEKVIYPKEPVRVSIWVERNALIDDTVKTAFQKALEDLKNGRLALGGSTTKGHGVFQSIEN